MGMQVVILAAGRGDRFASAGHRTLKPLILARGKPMLSYALMQAAVVTDKPTVICPESITSDVWACANYGLTDVKPSPVGIRYTQAGAAMSLLTAGCKLDETQPVMVMDCDSVIDLRAMAEFVRWTSEAFTQGVHSTIMAFLPNDDSDRYSFVHADFTNPTLPWAVEVVEKVRISSIATCGVHCFKDWATLRQGLCEMVCEQAKVRNEYYVAPVHNYIGNTAVYIVKDGDFTAVGTPEQLEEYERNIPQSE